MSFSSKNEGFTIIEILVVVTIISLLFIFLIPQINNASIKARETGVRIDFRDFQRASESLMRESLDVVGDADSLNKFLDRTHFVQNNKTNSKDPWGRLYDVEFDESEDMIVFKSQGSNKMTYTLATYIHNGIVSSCTNGFQTNNLILSYIDLPHNFECGGILSGFIALDPSTNEEITLPKEKNNGCYVIRTIGQLQAINNDSISLSACYELGNDIDASLTSSWNEGKGFEPIGIYGKEFNGIFNGNNFKIKNLTINRPNLEGVGLFGYSKDSVLKDIKLLDVKVIGKNRVGSLSGLIVDTKALNAYTLGEIVGEKVVGGLVGYNYHSSLSNPTIISYSHTNAKVYGEQLVGGLVGYTDAAITDSYSVSEVKGNTNVGGAIGGADTSKIKNIYAIGTVNGTSSIGGLSGRNLYGHTMSNSYYDKDSTRRTSSYGGIGKTTIEMKQQSTYVGWDFNNVWSISPTVNNGYPYLLSNPPK